MKTRCARCGLDRHRLAACGACETAAGPSHDWSLRTDVSVLYVDPRGPYPKLVADWWDEKRDARNYAGPNPVVAHPPCGPWGRLKFLNKHQDPNLGPEAVYQVRAWGGVLEHPEHSALFGACKLPLPSSTERPHVDSYGGFTLAVNQVAWGHRCKKATWLYMVNVPYLVALAGVRRGGKPTHRVTNGSRGDTSLPRIGSLEARTTPPEFAEWLISLAAQARPLFLASTTEPPSAASHLCGAIPHRGETDGRGGREPE